MHGQNQDTDSRYRFPKVLSGLKAAATRHGKIKNCDIRLQDPALLDGICSVRNFSDDLPVGMPFGENADKTLSHQFVIVGNQDSYVVLIPVPTPETTIAVIPRPGRPSLRTTRRVCARALEKSSIRLSSCGQPRSLVRGRCRCRFCAGR